MAAEGDPNPQGSPLTVLMFPMVAIAFLWYFLILKPQRREQRKRDELVNSLKKNDRVVTIGGIIGSVANVSADGKDVTVKVDDNTRIKFLRTSIQSVLVDGAEEDAAKK